MAGEFSIRELEKVESEWFSNPSPVICSRLADLLRRAGRHDEAKEIALGGLGKWKDNTSILIVLGRCYIDLGLPEKALETFEKVHSSFPRNLVALRNIAQLHYEKQHWSRAVDFFEEYLFENPGDDEMRRLMDDARSRQLSAPEQESPANETETETEAREPAPREDDDMVFPQTQRMQKVLESQGIDPGTSSGGEDDPASNAAMGSALPSNPESLLAFFTEEERQQYGLKPYSEED